MAEKDPRAERQAALAAHLSDREELVNFHIQMAEGSSLKIPAQMRAEEASSTAIADAERRLSMQIGGFAHVILKLDKADRALPSLRLTLAMFLLERTKQIRDAALAKDNLGIHSLYLSVREDVCALLGPSYYGMEFKDIISTYLDIEPRIMAVSQLCGLAMVPPAESIPSLYKKNLADAVSR